jgi:PIN domain nuclease of toxin-antitoxin system
LLAEPNTELILSVASVWEMQIKLQLGKLNLSLPLRELIENQQQTNNLELLPIDVSHVWVLENLPTPHKDPFDRIIIAQATVEQISILSVDAVFDEYPINRVW